MAKTRIIDELGEAALLLPGQVNRALEANDRVKYLLTLLQAARTHAEHPEAGVPDLQRERVAAGVTDAGLEEAIAGSRLEGGACHIPRAGQIRGLIDAGIRDMIAPLGNGVDWQARLDALDAALPPVTDDSVPDGFIEAATRARRGEGDSLHLLVMDLHKALNRLQSDIAEESVDGARTYGLGEGDRERVRAFMRGLNRTAPLKFDHPGLGTTATRTGGRLVIQNDIGTTDAHVLVVHVEGLRLSVTYTDIHMRRAHFFQSLFEGRGVTWQDTRSRSAEGLEEGGAYLLCVGTCDAGDEERLRSQLDFLGSRIVFLIDWNKARKRLRRFVRNADAIDLLKWAADNDHGHRGFLELGGGQLIDECIQHAFSGGVPYGERLDGVIGREAACSFLRNVLRASSESLRAGRSKRLVRDELRAELLAHVAGDERGFIDTLADHVSISVDLAHAVREALRDCCAGGTSLAARTARRAKQWESRADDLLIGAREGAARSAARRAHARLCEVADEVTDQLEEAAFLVSLLPEIALPRTLADALQALADVTVDGTQRLAAAVATLRDLERGTVREDLHDFLETIDDLVNAEHRADDGEREVIRRLVTSSLDGRHGHVVGLLARRFEKTGDALARTGFVLRDHVMSEVVSA